MTGRSTRFCWLVKECAKLSIVQGLSALVSAIGLMRYAMHGYGGAINWSLSPTIHTSVAGLRTQFSKLSAMALNRGTTLKPNP